MSRSLSPEMKQIIDNLLSIAVSFAFAFAVMFLIRLLGASELMQGTAFGALFIQLRWGTKMTDTEILEAGKKP